MASDTSSMLLVLLLLRKTGRAVMLLGCSADTPASCQVHPTPIRGNSLVG